jgi:acetyltransferase-like isoleucine patch superfamily enzyme
VVTKNVPAMSIAAGAPARVIKRLAERVDGPAAAQLL